MGGRLCVGAVLCHLLLCLSRATALQCYQTQLGPSPGLGATSSSSPASAPRPANGRSPGPRPANGPSPGPSSNLTSGPGPNGTWGPGPAFGPSPSSPPPPASAALKCEEAELCYHALLLVRTGPVSSAFSSKGCTPPGLQTTGVTHYRKPPEVSLTLYNHVCPTDLCNDDQTAASLWNESDGSQTLNRSSIELGHLECQACATPEACPEDSPYTPCPQGTRCYQGVIQLETSNFSLPLAIRGCGSWTDCSLLDDLWTPGPMVLKETCEDQRNAEDLSGKQTVRVTGASPDLSLAWKVSLGSVLVSGLLPTQF